MALSDEVSKLHELHQTGALTGAEFARAKASLLADGPVQAELGPLAGAPALAAFGSLRRSRSDCWVGGVCGGIARATGLDSWVVRLAFALLMLFGGAGLLIYALLWAFVPAE